MVVDTAAAPGAGALESIPTPAAAPPSPNTKRRRRRRKRRVKKLGGEHEALKRTLTDTSLGDGSKRERRNSNVEQQLAELSFMAEENGPGDGGSGSGGDTTPSALARDSLYATHADIAPQTSPPRRSGGRRRLQPLRAVPAGEPGNRYNE